MQNTTSTSVDLEWDPPSIQDQNGMITGYSLRIWNVETTENVRVINTSSSTCTRTPSTCTRITVYRLVPYTTYVYQIAASTSIGQGPFTTAKIQTNQDGKGQ